MAGYILGWVVLLWRPSWVFLFAFTAAVVTINAFGAFSFTSDPVGVALIAGVAGATFMAVGGPIVAIRLWLQSRKSKTDEEVDAELARIRAEAAARERPPAG